jgi:ribosomal protein S18 acetylase RimI-like enzyme
MTMSKIEIKKVTIVDIENLQNIGRQTFYETFAEANTEEDMQKYLNENFSTTKLKAELINPDSEFYFAITGKKVVGYLKINLGQAQTELKVKNALEIERIYVLNEFHGKQVGQVLYNKAIQVAKQYHVDVLWLGVWEENPRAIRFYLKNGFEEFDKHIFKLGNDEQTDIMMKLELNKYDESNH